MSEFSTPTEGHAISNVPFAESGRYILILIDSKVKQHDGKIFISLNEAKEYAAGCIDGVYADKAIIGFFSINLNAKEMLISCIETIGYKGDKKNVNQLELFSHFK